MKNKTILIFAGYYIPGYLAGGALRTISNMAAHLSEIFDLKIIALNRDFDSHSSYPGINTNIWKKTTAGEIFYTDLKVSFRQEIKKLDFDIYYLNSLFSKNFSIKIILLRKLGLIPGKPVILAPRGEIMAGALAVKSFKKRIFLTLVKFLRLYDDVVWHASNNLEAQFIRREFGDQVKIKTAMDVPDFSLLENPAFSKKSKERGKLKILFLSVINPKKNLRFVIDVLNQVKGDFELDIFGPVKEHWYFEDCISAILPEKKDRINYRGQIEHCRIAEIYPSYDIFFFPTLGENFGHVVFESLSLGCPVLTTNEVPWTDLEKHNAGWNIDLADKQDFIHLLEKLIDCDSDDFSKMVSGCREYTGMMINKDQLLEANRRLFE